MDKQLVLMFLIAGLFLTWGLKTKNPHFFVFGLIFIITSGILIYGTGIQTSNIQTIQTIKEGNNWVTTPTYITLTVDNDLGIWAGAWSMIILGFVMRPVSLYLIPKIKSYPIET